MAAWNAGSGEDKVTINDKEYPVSEVNADLLIKVARELGYHKFTVTVNDEIVESPDELEISAGDEVKITPYDEWGS